MEPVPIPEPQSFSLERFLKALRETQTPEWEEGRTVFLINQIEEIRAMENAL